VVHNLALILSTTTIKYFNLVVLMLIYIHSYLSGEKKLNNPSDASYCCHNLSLRRFFSSEYFLIVPEKTFTLALCSTATLLFSLLSVCRNILFAF